MSNSDIESVIKRMREACDAKNESQLARFLGIKSSTIVAWKNGKKPPYWACYELYEKTGYTVEWMISGDAPARFFDESTIKTFNIPPEEFVEIFYQAIQSAVHLRHIKFVQGTSIEDIERIAHLCYNSANDDVQLPKSADLDKKPETKIPLLLEPMDEC